AAPGELPSRRRAPSDGWPPSNPERLRFAADSSIGEGTVTGSASVRQADGRILRVGPVKDDGAADDLDHLGVRDAGGDRFAGLAGALGSGFEDLELQELASVEGVLHGLDGL